MLGLFSREGLRKYWRETIELYDDLYFTRLVKNNTDASRRFDTYQGQIGVDFTGTYYKNKVTFYYVIDFLPKELSIGFKTMIRREALNGVRVNFINYIRKHSIDWDSPQMRSRLRVLKEVSDENNATDVNAYNLHQNVGVLSKQSWIEESLNYLAIADKRRGRILVKTSILMMVSGVKGKDFDDSVVRIEEYTRHIGISMHRILYNVQDVVRFLSPFSRRYSKKVESTIPSFVLTDEILARFNEYSQGVLGKNGIIFGIDIYSRFPVLKYVKEEADTAEIWLITAETGGGKSLLAKDKLLQLLASKNFVGTVMDVNGTEYTPIANYLSSYSNVITLNLAEGTGKYLDPVEIFDAVGIDSIDSDAKNMSVNFTLALLKVLLGKAYNENVLLDTVINDALSGLYTKAGVTEDMSTWNLSKGLTLFDVYNYFYTLRDTRFRDSDDYVAAIELAIAVTGKYFEKTGTRSSIFQSRVSVSEIIDADLVVCSFGMAGRSHQSVDETQLALMQLGAAQLSHQRSIFSKSRGKFNFKYWEELQRFGNFPDSDKTLGVAITGGRHLGDVNVIITNDVGQILRDDKFSILPNITSYLIGAIADESVRSELCSRLSIMNMKGDLDKIAKAKKDADEADDPDSTQNIYRYAFLCGLDRSKFGVIKTELPTDLAKSMLFKTGVAVNNQDK